MGNRASSSSLPGTINLPEFHLELLKWQSRTSRTNADVQTPWTKSHLATILDYTLKLERVNSSSDSAPLSPCQAWRSGSFSYFQERLRELLKVPKIQLTPDGDGTVRRSELLADFLNFVLRLWQHPRTLPFEVRVDSLKGELRFLVSILRDTPFSRTDLGQVQNLLEDSENVANLAGSLVYCFVFTTVQQFESLNPKIVKAMEALFQRVDLLKANISNMLPSINVDAGDVYRKARSVGDPFSIVDSLYYSLEHLLNSCEIVHVKDQIQILFHELMFVLSACEDIRSYLHSETEEPKEPVAQLIDVAYETKYLIKSFSAENLPRWYLSLRLPQVTDKIKLIGTVLQEIQKDYSAAIVKSFQRGFLKVTKTENPPLSSRAKRNNEVGDLVIGFDENMTNVLGQLLGGCERVQLLSIHGMPGLGKTTLARKIYNHPSVNHDRFDKRSWAVVSQMYQRRRLLIDILTSSISELHKDRISHMEEEELADHLYKSLKGRRYLIVLDDIWSINVWDNFLRYFPDDHNGSRILFTTRNRDVAPAGSIVYKLPPLSNDQCWKLLKKKVFKDEPCPASIRRIGKKIAENCGGLPLAVVVTAGILSTVEMEESTWENVSENLASYFFDSKDNSVMQVLELSYRHLPGHLKPCFLYFGAFPEDAEIPAQKLMMIWIAEGYVKEEENKSAEAVAEEYLIELIDYSLVMVAKRRYDGGCKACVVHDLLHDLCLRKAAEENFQKLMDEDCSIYERHHRLCFNISKAQIEIFRPFFIPHVRSFFGRHLKTKPDLLSMKSLRALDLQGCECDPGAVRFLHQLRYLSGNETLLSISHLVNLEYLIVKTSRLVDIHPNILKVTKLRHLQLAPLAIFDEKCDGVLKNNIEYLSNVSISCLKEENLLRCSPDLRKFKCRCQPFSDDLGMLRYPNLEFLTRLESLKMTALRGYKNAEIIFPSNIKKLTLDGLRLPWEKMSVIGGLMNLEVLKLEYNACSGETWETREGEFEQLRFLKLEILDFHRWSVETSGHFPSLEQLVIRDCDNLREIPGEIGYIETLRSIEVESCLESLARSARKIEQEQRDYGNEEFRVAIGRVFRDG